MRMTTKGQYSIVALTYMKNRENRNPVTLKEISKAEDISIHYLEQLFRKLRQAGLVESIRGPGGGYILAREEVKKGAKTTYQDIEINYYDVMDAVGEGLSLETKGDTKTAQEVRTKLGMINDAMITNFEAMTI